MNPSVQKMKIEKTEKIFGIGFQKTGTSTLRKALQILDYSVCDCSCARIVKLLKKDDWPTIFATVEQYDAFQDNPWPLAYKELDRQYPNSKFILTIRNEDSWMKSVSNHLQLFPDRVQTWVYGKGFPVGYEDIYLEKYRRHNQDVLDYFKERPADLLIVDWTKGDDWTKLCQFLQAEEPLTRFPHEKKGRYYKIKNYWLDISSALIKSIRSGNNAL